MARKFPKLEKGDVIAIKETKKDLEIFKILKDQKMKLY